MPPKRKARPSTPPSTKKKAANGVQASIDSFFTSPSKAKVNERAGSVISIGDSDDDLPIKSDSQEAQDAKLARQLAADWGRMDKGKGRDSSEDGDIVVLDAPSGINGSSSSKLRSPPSPPMKPLHAMFSTKAPRTPSPKLESIDTDVKPTPKSAEVTTASAEPVEPIDFDTDAFLFKPSEIDISNWPKGRLPYSVLVGVYVQVSSTRSRLTIVRVLTK